MSLGFGIHDTETRVARHVRPRTWECVGVCVSTVVYCICACVRICQRLYTCLRAGCELHCIRFGYTFETSTGRKKVSPDEPMRTNLRPSSGLLGSCAREGQGVLGKRKRRGWGLARSLLMMRWLIFLDMKRRMSPRSTDNHLRPQNVGLRGEVG